VERPKEGAASGRRTEKNKELTGNTGKITYKIVTKTFNEINNLNPLWGVAGSGEPDVSDRIHRPTAHV
jgi:hypothetical protein